MAAGSAPCRATRRCVVFDGMCSSYCPETRSDLIQGDLSPVIVRHRQQARLRAPATRRDAAVLSLSCGETNSTPVTDRPNTPSAQFSDNTRIRFLEESVFAAMCQHFGCRQPVLGVGPCDPDLEVVEAFGCSAQLFCPRSHRFMSVSICPFASDD